MNHNPAITLVSRLVSLSKGQELVSQGIECPSPSQAAKKVHKLIQESHHLRNLENSYGMWSAIIPLNLQARIIQELDSYLNRHMYPGRQVSNPAPLMYACWEHSGVPYLDPLHLRIVNGKTPRLIFSRQIAKYFPLPVPVNEKAASIVEMCDFRKEKWGLS